MITLPSLSSGRLPTVCVERRQSSVALLSTAPGQVSFCRVHLSVSPRPHSLVERRIATRSLFCLGPCFLPLGCVPRVEPGWLDSFQGSGRMPPCSTRAAHGRALLTRTSFLLLSLRPRDQCSYSFGNRLSGVCAPLFGLSPSTEWKLWPCPPSARIARHRSNRVYRNARNNPGTMPTCLTRAPSPIRSTVQPLRRSIPITSGPYLPATAPSSREVNEGREAINSSIFSQGNFTPLPPRPSASIGTDRRCSLRGAGRRAACRNILPA